MKRQYQLTVVATKLLAEINVALTKLSGESPLNLSERDAFYLRHPGELAGLKELTQQLVKEKYDFDYLRVWRGGDTDFLKFGCYTGRNSLLYFWNTGEWRLADAN